MTTSKFKIVPPKKWQILESGQGGTERRKNYLANCSAFEVEVRKLTKYHKIEIKRAKAQLQEFPNLNTGISAVGYAKRVLGKTNSTSSCFARCCHIEKVGGSKFCAT